MRMVKRFPQEEDFHGAAQALIRLQDTYELNMTELVQGNVWGRQTHAGSISCFVFFFVQLLVIRIFRLYRRVFLIRISK